MSAEPLTPSSLLSFPDETIFVKTKAHTYKHPPLSDDEHEHHRLAWIKHDLTTNVLYVKAREFRNMVSMDRRWNALLSSGQYVGSSVYAFYGYTPFRAPSCEVFIFDLTLQHSGARAIPKAKAHKQYLLYVRKFGVNSPKINEAMATWETRTLARLAREGRMDTHEPTDSDIKLAKMQKRLDAMNARLMGRKPKKKEKPTATLPALDEYITEFKRHIRREMTRRVVEDGKARLESKSYDPSPLPVVGRYEDITNLQGHRTVRLAIHTSALKLSVPDFKKDKRYLRSASVRLSSTRGVSSVWCAIFDLGGV